MSGESDEPDEEVEIVGDTVGCNYFKIFATPMVADSSQTYSRQYEYTPEMEKLLRGVKSDWSYFDDTGEPRETYVELLVTDPILSRLTDAGPEDFEGYRDENS